jgi:cyclophilin family peptidyl-prolyl cis-trans isomerase
VSKRQHQRQLARARDKRRSDRFDRRRRRARLTAIAAAAALLLSVFAAVLVNALDGGDAQAGPECRPGEDVPDVAAEQYDEPPEMEIDEEATYVATLDTTCGTIVVELDAAGAPMATNNFVFLAREGFYDGVTFHRVINDFMIQGGDPEGTGSGGPGYTFEDELGPAEEHYDQVREDVLAELAQLEESGEIDADEQLDPDTVPGGYEQGRLAMANSGPDTNGSQFFITHGDPAILPGPDYTLFGEVVEGFDVVDVIATEATDDLDRPLEPIHIRGIEIDER